MKRAAPHGLGTLQTEVMEILWERGSATVADVVEAIGQKRPVTYTTVLVAMQKLEKKGWLKHRSQGRAYVYRPARTRGKVYGGLLRDILHSAFHRDPRLLLFPFAGRISAERQQWRNCASDQKLAEKTAYMRVSLEFLAR